jgi:hypothetical protein
MLTSRVGTAENNFALPAVTAKIEHPIELAIRFSRGKCPLFIPYELAVAVGGDKLNFVNIAQAIQSAANQALKDTFDTAFFDALRTIMVLPSLGLSTQFPVATVTPTNGYFQPHFFRNADGQFEGGLSVGGTFHVDVSTAWGFELDIGVRAAYSLRPSIFSDPGPDGTFIPRWVQATPLPKYSQIGIHLDPGNHPYADFIKESVRADLTHALGIGCRTEPDKCVVEQIERAFRDAMNGTIQVRDAAGTVVLTRTFPQVLQDLYGPDGLGPEDTSRVHMLPTGIDFVVFPDKCPSDWLERRADVERAAEAAGFQLDPFKTVDFETDLLPAYYEGYAGYCSLGRPSL